MTGKVLADLRGELPLGFEVRLADGVRRLDDGRVLVGGSPLRVVRLKPRALGMVDGGRVRVVDGPSRTLAETLLRSNVATPVFDDRVPVEASDLTVVIPVRDRPEQLDRALALLRPTLSCLVVDDASRDPAAVARVAARHGVELLPLDHNVGPAAARNIGLRRLTTAYVAFVDSDVAVEPASLLALARHFADPRVAVVAPRIRGRARSRRPRWFERYDEEASSLDLGSTACSVRPGSAVGWVPSACLVARVDRLGDGFDPAMRVGEDVDLVWRLVEDGWTVRYDPAFEAEHDARATLRSWMGRKFVYGTGGAALATRHAASCAVAVLSPASALGAAALLARRRWSLPVALLCWCRGVLVLQRALPDVPGRRALSVRLATRGAVWALRQESALFLRHWWPPVAFALLFSCTARRIAVTAMLVDAAAARQARPELDPVTAFAGRRFDDLAYGAGLWVGALRACSVRALAVRMSKGG